VAASATGAVATAPASMPTVTAVADPSAVRRRVDDEGGATSPSCGSPWEGFAEKFGVCDSSEQGWHDNTLIDLFEKDERSPIDQSGQAGPEVHDDPHNRDFTAAATNVEWLVNITEHWTMNGKIYVCLIKDCASNRIVGYAVDSRTMSELR